MWNSHHFQNCQDGNDGFDPDLDRFDGWGRDHGVFRHHGGWGGHDHHGLGGWGGGDWGWGGHDHHHHHGGHGLIGLHNEFSFPICH